MAEQQDQANLEFTDVVGMAKCVTIPVEQLPDCLIHGKWFDGSAIEGFARVAESDMYLFPDLATFAILPGKVRPTQKYDSDQATDLAATVRRQMVQALQQMHINIESSHHEVAAGQHELDFETGDALSIADGLMTAKYVLKAIAAQHGLYATFLPKPLYGINGSGLHTHQQLISIST